MVNMENVNLLKASLTSDNAKKKNVGFNMRAWVNTWADERHDKLDGCKTTACGAGWCYILEHHMDLSDTAIRVFGSTSWTTFDKEIDNGNGFETIAYVANADLVEGAARWLGLPEIVAQPLFGSGIVGIEHLTPQNFMDALDLAVKGMDENKTRDATRYEIIDFYQSRINRQAYWPLR